MSKSEDDSWVGKLVIVIVAVVAAVGLFLWIFYEIAKAGVKGKDVTIHRCGNCNMVLKPQQTPCPNCGYEVIWK